MEQFLTEIDGFMSEFGIKPSAFGEDFAKDRGFVRRIRSGKDCGLRKADDVRAQMADYRVKHSQDTAA